MTGAEHGGSPRDETNWSARYRFDPRAEWRDCRIVDLSFDGATVELEDVALVEPVVGNLHLEISSIAADQVGVELSTVVRRADRRSANRAVADVDFAHWRREESLLLHLLVGLRNYA